MELVNLGRTGLKVSRICLGCMTYGSTRWRKWVLDEEASRPFFRQAWEAGINFFDTADMYSDGASEEVLGRALVDLAIPREQVVVATKVFNPMGPTLNERGLSRKHIKHSIDNSLRRLKLDYVDLYQIHRFDPTTPIEETLEALNDVVRAGKALHIGASSMFAWQMAKMLRTSDRLGLARFATMQNHYNLIYRDNELLSDILGQPVDPPISPDYTALTVRRNGPDGQPAIFVLPRSIQDQNQFNIDVVNDAPILPGDVIDQATFEAIPILRKAQVDRAVTAVRSLIKMREMVNRPEASRGFRIWPFAAPR